MSLSDLLICFIPELFVIFITIFFYKQVSETKVNLNLYKIIALIVLTILSLLNNFYTPAAFRLIVTILLAFSIIVITFKPKISDAIYYTLFYAIMGIVVELLLTIILVLIDIPNINELNDSILLKIVLTLIHTLVMYILLLNNKVLKLIRKLKYLLKFKRILIFIIAVLDIVVIYRGYTLKDSTILALSIVISTFVLLTLRVIINDKYNIKLLLDRNKGLKESYKAYSETIEDCKEFKHNIKNELYTIKSILPVNKQEIINNIIKKYNTNYEWISKIDEIPEGLQGIIYLKQNEAKKKKVTMVINTKDKIKSDDKDYFDLGETLGILLDNAIDACSNLKIKIMDVYINENKTSVDITIKNKFSNKIDLNKISKKNYSTKEYKSGIGLNYIKNLKNPNINVKYNIINDLFITKVTYNTK